VKSRRRIGVISAGLLPLLFLLAFAVELSAQSDAFSDRPSVENLQLTAKDAYTWTRGQTSIIQLQGAVSIQMEHRLLQADSAVVWITPRPSALLEEQDAQIVLIGHASLSQDQIKRTGPYLLVNAVIRGSVRVTAETRLSRDLSESDLYRHADALRTSQGPLASGIHIAPTSRPSTGPATALIRPLTAISGQWQHLETIKTPDGKITVILSGGVSLNYNQLQAPKGATTAPSRAPKAKIEFQGDTAVLFTNLTSFQQITSHLSAPQAAEAIYLEGNAHIDYTPQEGKVQGEQRLEARRVYYELATDRAILSDAVFHTTDPKTQLPILIRADTIHQLARDEFDAEGVQLTSSQFQTPSISIAADKAYIHRIVSVTPDEPNETYFEADSVTLQAFNVPFFYFPSASGEFPNNVITLRGLAFGGSRRFGPSVRTEWGLFESLGAKHPRTLDATYNLDYFGDRGPAAGFNADYAGGFVTEESKDPINFTGSLRSFFIHDEGTDEFGGLRPDIKPPEQTRGNILWSHQQFLPENWQIQLHAGYFSDATFLEEWNRSDWYSNVPYNLSGYAKHQHDSEAFTILGVYNPNKSVSNVDQLQEQFDVDRLPELTYHRIGDNLGDTDLTLFSDNSVDALEFHRAHADLVNQSLQYPAKGGVMGPPKPNDLKIQNEVGLPSQGFAGASFDPKVPDTTTYRGDLREELDYPFALGQFRLVPYVMGRYIPYSQTIDHFVPGKNLAVGDGSATNRFFGGGGARLTTAFWAVDDDVQSDMFDLHRLRHVIEPEVHVFSSAQTVDRTNLLIYDEDVDGINDISAAQIALRQRWQTQRGGPGRWRSVDFVTLNVEADLFANKPPENELRPAAFRGLFFDSLPEASVPRDSINADATWRISDTTVFLADESFNTDKQKLALISGGIAVRRDPHIAFFIGDRYIDELHSNIITSAVSYELSHKYTLLLSQSFDTVNSQTVGSTFGVLRKFDAFYVVVSIFYDGRQKDSGVSFSIVPNGFSAGVGNQAFQSVFTPQQ